MSDTSWADSLHQTRPTVDCGVKEYVRVRVVSESVGVRVREKHSKLILNVKNQRKKLRM